MGGSREIKPPPASEAAILFPHFLIAEKMGPSETEGRWRWTPFTRCITAVDRFRCPLFYPAENSALQFALTRNVASAIRVAVARGATLKVSPGPKSLGR